MNYQANNLNTPSHQSPQDEIICYKCNNGFPIGKKFPYQEDNRRGVCPVGWTTHSNPCDHSPELPRVYTEFKKKVYGDKAAREVLDEEFTEFIITPRTAEDFFELYNEYFHQIPLRDIKGKDSHFHLIERSKDYIGDYINPLLRLITTLETQKEDIQNEIDNIEHSHPYLTNNSIVMDENYEGNETEGVKFLIQSGKKRPILGEGDNLYLNIKNQLGFTNRPENEFIHYFSTPGLGMIPSGPNIEEPSDIFIETRFINTYNPGEPRKLPPRYQKLKPSNVSKNLNY